MQHIYSFFYTNGAGRVMLRCSTSTQRSPVRQTGRVFTSPQVK